MILTEVKADVCAQDPNYFTVHLKARTLQTQNSRDSSRELRVGMHSESVNM